MATISAAARPNPQHEVVEVTVLGAVTAVARGGVAALGGPKDRGILAQLALADGRPVGEEALIDGTWGDDHPRRADKALQNQVLRLRRAIRAVSAGPVIATEADGYRLARCSAVTDLGRAEAAIESARRAAARHDGDLASSLLRDALAEWRGEPLAGLGDLPFAAPARTRLRELRWTAFEERVEADLVCGRQRRLVPELYEAVHESPLRESLWVQLMVALYRSGRQAEALRAFQEVRRRLDDELGLGPGARLCAIESAIATGTLPHVSLARGASTASRRHIAALRASASFADLDDAALARLAARFEATSAAPGEHLTTQGDEGANLFVVVAGQAEVRIDGRAIATVGPGDLVGEMALIDDEPCVADVVATTAMHLLRMDRSDFGGLREDQVFASRLLRSVVHRLRVYETA